MAFKKDSREWDGSSGTDLEASHILFPKQDTAYVEAASRFQTVPQMHSEVLMSCRQAWLMAAKVFFVLFFFIVS